MDNLVERVSERIDALFYDHKDADTIARAIIPIVMEEAAKLTDERVEHYRQKAAKHDPLAADTCTDYERYVFAAEATIAAAYDIRTRSSEIAGLSKESE